jgi:hypothetical protein
VLLSLCFPCVFRYYFDNAMFYLGRSSLWIFLPSGKRRPELVGVFFLGRLFAPSLDACGYILSVQRRLQQPALIEQPLPQ